MCEHSERVKVQFMSDFGAVRDEIKQDLQLHRAEHREDVKDLYKHIDSKFDKLSEEFSKVRDDVTEHKVKFGKIGMVGMFFGSIAGVISAWVVSHVGTSI